MRWHFRSQTEPGTVKMFSNRKLLGAARTPARAVAANDGKALFRVLVATAMFQRQRDVQVQRILRSLSPREAAELLDPRALVLAARRSPCRHLRSVTELHEVCDLTKNGATPVCGANPRAACPPKKHARMLRRYGDFGKLPISAALVVETEGSLPKLRARVLREFDHPHERALQLEAAIARVWRVSTKIAAMFLSCIANPDLSPEAPWADALDWTHFVVIDSNVDTFLASIGYVGDDDYEAKRAFVRALALAIDLRALDGRLRHAFNPRLVQQAMYLFMSTANRRAAPRDCSLLGAAACGKCVPALSSRCPVRSVSIPVDRSARRRS